ncbi:MAG TPA: GvpL/GvpF family gas vesicle protein [Longimicrobiales bacterium]|nr:GvpL/GvpF family gas vesicle protein [Longimicrobiales bacterium]
MAIYLYGFTPEAAPGPPGTLLGVDDAAVELLPFDDLVAVVSRVPGEWDAPATLDALLREMDWVARQGLAHETVVAWFVDHGHIVPAPFLTLFSSAERLSGEVAARRAQIAEQLRRFRSVREWDVKVAYDAARVGEHLGELAPEVAALDVEIAAATPGRRFLLQKKRAERVRDLTASTAREQAAALLDRLRGHAADSRVLPLPRADDAVPVVLNAALLVERDAEEGLRQDLERSAAELERLGITVRFSGPWAPYRFVQEEEVSP